MPRFSLEPEGTTRDPAKEFDLCARCAVDPGIVQVVAAKRAGLPLGGTQRLPVRTVPHASYDFSAQPHPCVSCARILSAEDD